MGQGGARPGSFGMVSGQASPLEILALVDSHARRSLGMQQACWTLRLDSASPRFMAAAAKQALEQIEARTCGPQAAKFSKGWSGECSRSFWARPQRIWLGLLRPAPTNTSGRAAPSVASFATSCAPLLCQQRPLFEATSRLRIVTVELDFQSCRSRTLRRRALDMLHEFDQQARLRHLSVWSCILQLDHRS